MSEKKSVSARIGSAFGAALALLIASGATMALAIIIAKILRWLWFI